MKREKINILDALSLSKREVISIIGGGGKTSLVEYLSRDLHSRGKLVISTTTTKIFPPRQGISEVSVFTTTSSWLNTIDSSFREGKFVNLATDMLPEGKLKGISLKRCNMVLNKSNVDYLIIEADGSRGKSIKAHSRWEPVVPSFTTLFIAVIGIDCLHKRIDDDVCHRSNILCSLLGCNTGELIDEDLILKLFKHPGGYLKKLPRKARAYVFINKVHEETELQKGILLGEKLLSLNRICGVFTGHLKPAPDKITFITR